MLSVVGGILNRGAEVLYTTGSEKKCSGRIMISALDLFVSCATGILNIIVAIVYDATASCPGTGAKTAVPELIN